MTPTPYFVRNPDADRLPRSRQAASRIAAASILSVALLPETSPAEINYVGIDKVHLTYSGGDATTFRLELKRGDETLVDVGGSSFSGT